MKNFDEVKIVISLDLVIKKGSGMKEAKRISDCVQSFVNSNYPNENLKVEVFKNGETNV